MELRIKTYQIPVKPIAWQRAKLRGQRFFDGQNAEKVAFGLYLLKQHNNEPLFDKSISIDVVFYMPISPTKKGRVDSTWHATVPDLDNCIKFLSDAIKNVLITDDRIISSLSAKKIYSKSPRTEFIIRELE